MCDNKYFHPILDPEQSKECNGVFFFCCFLEKIKCSDHYMYTHFLVVYNLVNLSNKNISYSKLRKTTSDKNNSKLNSFSRIIHFTYCL